MRFIRAAAAALGLAVVATGAVAVPVSAAADPNVVYACVKKSNGDVKIVTETKKCKKGWVKISWNVTGPQGPAGPQGPVGPSRNLVDSKGTVVGTIMAAWAGGYFSVQNAGGLYGVNENAVLDTESIFYLDSKCMGAAYMWFAKDDPDSAGAPNTWRRFVQQTPDKHYWAFAYQGFSTQIFLPTQVYRSNFPGGGSCQSLGSVSSGFLFSLSSVPAPQPVAGRLAIQ
jgi:hypothetical protein